MASTDEQVSYNAMVEEVRASEYPMLLGTTYLDHAGTTPYAKSMLEKWTAELTANLFGNPHSASAASQLSTRRIEDIRLRVLKSFNASSDDFDVVFVANATAAIKLVAEAFRDHHAGFWFGYHGDAHTSLVGCREWAVEGNECFEDDNSMETWIQDISAHKSGQQVLRLVAYPGQSNMTGRRLPLEWAKRIRRGACATQQSIYTLFDAASLACTTPLDFSDAAAAPDFTALSFYKIFGLPDLGAMLVRKASADVLMRKRYFAGGTVDAVVNGGDFWHAKSTTVHKALEEGTLPFHNIIALDHAMKTHAKLFGSMQRISEHTRRLAHEARAFLSKLCHANGTPVSEVYDTPESEYGPIIAFNLRDCSQRFISAYEVEKLCIVKGIQVRTGGLCNPGGISRHLNLSAEQTKSNYSAGHRCGEEARLIQGNPTGAIRISFGAMSTQSDLQRFISFIHEYYVEQELLMNDDVGKKEARHSYFVEGLSVFPIKSCGSFVIPADQKWAVTVNGLAWDREWCLVHEGSNFALSQKRYPNMALLQPRLDLIKRKMIISYKLDITSNEIEIDLDETPSTTTISAKICPVDSFLLRNSRVCGDDVALHTYRSATINDFFSKALGVPCCLARYPSQGSSRKVNIRRPSPDMDLTRPLVAKPQMKLANESPMLIISRSSVDELNRQIFQRAQQKNATHPLEVPASSFRANIVVAESSIGAISQMSAYSEDSWTSVTILPDPSRETQDSSDTTSLSTSSLFETASSHSTSPSIPGSYDSSAHVQRRNVLDDSARALELEMLGPCQRCQMVSIDQATAQSQQEPFSTLAKTRRKGDGRVWFGVHAALRRNTRDVEDVGAGNRDQEVYIQVGDLVEPHVGVN